MSLQERIKEAIQAALNRGATIGDIAKAAGKTPSAVSQWKSGAIKSLKADSAAGLERITGYRSAWLITGKGEKFTGANWPFTLFSAEDFAKLDERTRQEIEDSIAGKIQRSRLQLGNGTTGPGFS